MKSLLLICAGLSFLAILVLPIGYYTLLRIVISIGGVAVILEEKEKGLNFWVILFGLTVIVFNPILPVHLNDRAAWVPLNIACGILFLVRLIYLEYYTTKNKD